MSPELSFLIAAAKAKVAAAEGAKAAQVKAKTARTEEARVAAQAEADALRATIDWQPAALVLVLENWECACGADGTTPVGVFILQEHTRLANSIRLVPPRNEADIGDLPRRYKYESRVCALCPECAESAGFLTRYVSPLPPAQRRNPAPEPGPFVREWLTLRAPSQE